MNIVEAMELRHAGRDFSDRPIDDDTLRALNEAVDAANASTTSIRFTRSGRRGHCLPSPRTRRASRWAVVSWAIRIPGRASVPGASTPRKARTRCA